MHKLLKSLIFILFNAIIVGCGNDGAGDLTDTQQVTGSYVGFMQTIDGENLPWALDHNVQVSKVGVGRLRISSDIIGEFEVYSACLVDQICLNGDVINIADFFNEDLDVIEVKEVIFTRMDTGWKLVIQYVAVPTGGSFPQVNQFISTQ